MTEDNYVVDALLDLQDNLYCQLTKEETARVEKEDLHVAIIAGKVVPVLSGELMRPQNR